MSHFINEIIITCIYVFHFGQVGPPYICLCVCVYDFDILKVHSTDFTHACQLNLHRVYIHLDSEEVLS